MRYTQQEELLLPKELAAKLRRPVPYVYAMRRAGFEMPGKLATLSSALEWLSKNPPPRSNKHKRAKTGGNG